MIEIRTNRDGSVDEVVADCATVHLEQLNTGLWYLRIESWDDVHWAVTLNLNAKRGFVYESGNVVIKCTDSETTKPTSEVGLEVPHGEA